MNQFEDIVKTERWKRFVEKFYIRNRDIKGVTLVMSNGIIKQIIYDGYTFEVALLLK